ncbi:FTR1 family iron permease [Pseudomonas marincola]|uniref:FTR1 family iron permease n=1 Tax=Pseudomonas marincola TaxID=437900 RepID=UPI0008DEBD12|nr:FTR1 family protein [Pseudomonas marincola]SFT43233.1 high-affinity iron transporter [Pseudomonas marincola]
MLSTALIVFREIVEAALVVSIVLAATRGVASRGRWVGGGVLAGIGGAGLLALFADALSELASGMGQEVFNALVMLIAVVMLGWHSIWMGQHGREMSAQLNEMGQAVVTGNKSLAAMAIVVALAILREGSETVLFLYGIAVSEPGQAWPMMAGGLLGITAGIAVGVAIYFGLMRMAMRHLFKVTNALVILMAAGMASQCAGFLVAADWLPALGDTLWDTSALLSEHSITGKLLHTLIGYTAQPSGVQVLAYLACLSVILGLGWLTARPKALQPQMSH